MDYPHPHIYVSAASRFNLAELLDRIDFTVFPGYASDSKSDGADPDQPEDRAAAYDDPDGTGLGTYSGIAG